MFSSQSTPSLVAHWNPATTESLISFRYWTPKEQGNCKTYADYIIIEITLRDINKEIWSSSVRTEAPNLTGLGDIVLILVRQVTTTNFEVVTCVNFPFIDIFSQTIGHRDSLHVKTIVLVGRLRQTNLVGLL